MVQFVSNSSLNPASLSLDDLYIVNIPPPSFIAGSPTDIGGLVGTASWGPVNSPVTIGSLQQLQQAFGPLSPASVLDPHDLATDGLLAIQQAQGLGSASSLVCVRVTDGTDVAASGSLLDSSSSVLLNMASIYTGSFGNQCTVNVTPGSKPGTSNVAINLTGEAGEAFTGIPNATFQASFISALKNGISGIRGPSQLLSASYPTVAAPAITAGQFTPSASGGSLDAGNYHIVATYTNAQGETVASNEITIAVPGTTFGSIAFDLVSLPSAATGVNIYMTQLNGLTGTETLDLSVTGFSGNITTVPGMGAPLPPTVNTATILNTNPPKVQLYTLSGGLDGRSVNSSQLVGNDYDPNTNGQPTGAFALRGQNVSVFAVCGLTDSTVWANLVPLADSEGMVLVLTFPQGMSTTAAISTKNTVGIDDFNVVLVKDFIYFFDSVNNKVRSISATGTYVGHIISLSPEQNIGNKNVFGVIGTDRLNPITGSIPYTNAELAQLESNGINLITNPIPLGRSFGVRHGQNSSSNAAESQVEFARMTNFLDRSFGSNLGQFVGKLQSQDPNDPLRAAVVNTINSFLANLQALGKIDSYKVVCDLTNNTFQTIAQHFLYAFVKVQYLSAVRFFILQLQGGTTVNVSSGSTASEAAAGVA